MQRLGRYRIGRLLGEGGAGQVYEALLEGPGGLRMPVALKVLHEGAAGLRREARIGGLLRHRNLVDVYEIGEDDGRWFCALERCDASLSAPLPLPPRAVVEVGLQVCAALQYAHEELSLVHLDLKPGNLLRSGATVKVGDLGIAHARGFRGERRVQGTPGYMPPEQLAGGPLDARADVYALGVTLTELATGAPPVASDTLDLASLDDPTGPAPAPPDTPAWLAPVVERCLAPDPNDRWPDMASLAAALRALPVDGPGLRETLGIAAPTPAAADPLAGPELVGRERDLVRLEDALAGPGLVTLKGPAGIGKSSLALAVARRWRDHGRFATACRLAEVGTREGLLAAVSAALQVPPRRIRDALAGRSDALLVLDNFEQIVALAPEVASWGEVARLLITSREPLRVGGEAVVEVEPLDERAATELLVERAADRGAEIAGDPDLPELARRLDGVPLALELAAGRLGVLSVRDVLEHLGPALLRRGTEDRHGTLHAALDWSWALLSEVERAALAQLTVFAGGFTLPAAEAVLELDGASVLDTIGALVDRSLVRSLEGGRFDLLLSVHAWASEKLADRRAAETRHGRWFADLDDPGTHEVDNLEAAVRRALVRGDASLAADAAQGFWTARWLQGPSAEAAALLRQVAGMPGLAGRSLVRACVIAGTATRHAGDVQTGGQLLERALVEARAIGDRAGEATALDALGSLARQCGQAEVARERYERALALRRAEGQRRPEATTLGNLGLLAFSELRYDEARRCFEASLALHRAEGNRRSEGVVVGNLGLACWYLDRLDEAQRCLQDALAIHRELGNQMAEANVLISLANLLRLDRGAPAEAAAHYERARTLFRESGDRTGEAALLGNLAMLPFNAGQWDDAAALLEQAISLGIEAGAVRHAAFARDSLAGVRARQGRLDEAWEQALLALELSRSARHWAQEARSQTRLGELALRGGRLDEAVAHLDAALAIAREHGVEALQCRPLGGLANVHARRGDEEAARRLLALAEQALLSARHEPTERVGQLLLRAEALATLGDLDAARADVAAAEALIPSWRRDLKADLQRVRARL